MKKKVQITNIEADCFPLILVSSLIRDSSDDTALSYGIDGCGSISGRGKRFFSSS
jgi:hypothetical protein